MMLYVLIVRRFRDFRSRNLIFVSLICWGADFLVFVLLMRERVEVLEMLLVFIPNWSVQGTFLYI